MQGGQPCIRGEGTRRRRDSFEDVRRSEFGVRASARSANRPAAFSERPKGRTPNSDAVAERSRDNAGGSRPAFEVKTQGVDVTPLKMFDARSSESGLQPVRLTASPLPRSGLKAGLQTQAPTRAPEESQASAIERASTGTCARDRAGVADAGEHPLIPGSSAVPPTRSAAQPGPRSGADGFHFRRRGGYLG